MTSKSARTPKKANSSAPRLICHAKAQRGSADELRPCWRDVFALYLKTKNFHWHMSGPHFRDYHLLLDEQADQIFAISDDIAERARKIGETTLHSISEISKYQRLKDNSEPFVSPKLMLAELHQDNLQLVEYMRNTHADHLAS
jgi:starvation-inducible DNA-binding protein